MTGRASDGSDSYSYIWSVAACGSAISGRPVVLQRDEGEEGVERLSRRSLVPVRAAQRCTPWLTTPTCRGLGCLSIGARGVPDSGAAPECTEPPVSTLLLSAVHPVTPYTHTQPSTASRELCGTLSARAG
jgi:hypothetical protein